jgi:hypothetical protein
MPTSRTHRHILCLLLLVPWVFRADASGAPYGGFAAVLDQALVGTDSPRSVVFFDVDDLSRPLFSVFVGAEAVSTTGNLLEDPDSITVDPVTGDVYVLAFDSGIPSSAPLTEVEADGDEDSEGDYDLLRIDFQSAYDYWQANYAATNTFVTFGDGTSAFDALHANPQTAPPAPAVVEKVGEVGRGVGDGQRFDSYLEFFDQDTLVYIGSNSGSFGGATDLEIRAIRRVSSSPGLATPSGIPPGTEGGFNNGTAESWQSVLLGNVGLDGGTSDVRSIAAVQQRDGVSGIWILEGDPVGQGDQLAFFQIANFNGPSGNGYLTINANNQLATSLTLAANPSVDPLTHDGSGDRILFDSQTGDVIVIESGFFDGVESQAYRVAISTYANASNEVAVSGYSANSAVDAAAIFDDDLETLDTRSAFYDRTQQAVYFVDRDGAADPETGGIDFGVDWYRLDLATGVTTAVGPDADVGLGLYRNNDNIEFFYLAPPPPDADFNGDSIVDGEDLLAWQRGVGITSAALHADGDANSDGAVDASDLSVWQSQFGTSPTRVAQSPVPEPDSLLMALTSLLGIARACGSRHKA